MIVFAFGRFSRFFSLAVFGFMVGLLTDLLSKNLTVNSSTNITFSISNFDDLFCSKLNVFVFNYIDCVRNLTSSNTISLF